MENQGRKRILVVVDMQNDFIDGSLGTEEAAAIIKPILEKISTYSPDSIYATRDTHEENYLETAEGKHLPVPHCIKGTKGWQLRKEIQTALPAAKLVDKPSFASWELIDQLKEEAKKQEIEVELVGLCTDICVVSNALLLKAALPETPISVDASCCAGVTQKSHEAALLTMQMCQIEVIGLETDEGN